MWPLATVRFPTAGKGRGAQVERRMAFMVSLQMRINRETQGEPHALGGGMSSVHRCRGLYARDLSLTEAGLVFTGLPALAQAALRAKRYGDRSVHLYSLL